MLSIISLALCLFRCDAPCASKWHVPGNCGISSARLPALPRLVAYEPRYRWKNPWVWHERHFFHCGRSPGPGVII
eukprot:11024090-Alexandrium_andersonii.AAC.1